MASVLGIGLLLVAIAHLGVYPLYRKGPEGNSLRWKGAYLLMGLLFACVGSALVLGIKSPFLITSGIILVLIPAVISLIPTH